MTVDNLARELSKLKRERNKFTIISLKNDFPPKENSFLYLPNLKKKNAPLSEK